MFGLRSARAVTFFFGILLVLAVLAVLLFGAIAHALIPHSHDGGEAVWEELHATLRYDTKAVTASLGLVLTLCIPVVALSATVRYQQSISADILLRRGIHKHRRFL